VPNQRGEWDGKAARIETTLLCGSFLNNKFFTSIPASSFSYLSCQQNKTREKTSHSISKTKNFFLSAQTSAAAAAAAVCCFSLILYFLLAFIPFPFSLSLAFSQLCFC
jgi:hypothetical protein